jgi:hypothetical protein
MKIRFHAAALVAFAQMVSIASCGGGARSSFGGDANDDLDAATDDASDDSIVFADAADSSVSCPDRCSGDLHSVLDCNGVVKRTCPMDQGCGATGCVPACEAARANRSTVGCDYYAIQPEGSAYSAGCFAVFVANTWTTPVTLSASWAGGQLDISRIARIPSGSGRASTYAPLPNDALPPGQVAILFLSNGGQFPCPAGDGGVTPEHAGAVTGTTIDYAFHLTASAPVAAYDIYPYGGGNSAVTSATLLLPTSAWDTNYVAFNAYPMSLLVGSPPTIQIIAQENGTNVTISPTAAIRGGAGVQPTEAGAPQTYTLDQGQVLQLAQPTELTGSPIQSDKPVGMWSSMACFNVEVATTYCDSTHQQIPPVRALGSEYVGVRYRSRVDGTDEVVPWRIMGLLDGTHLTWEPSRPPGAPTGLAAGQVVKFDAPGPFVVSSQDDLHPFYLASYMTSCTMNGQDIDQGPFGCAGDPEFVNVVPGKQFLGSYVFFTDPTYPETNLVFVRTKSPAGFKDVTLDCAGVLTGWQPVGTSGSYEYTRFDLVRHDFAKQGSCDNGRHEAHSDAPFGLTVWGWGNNETGSFYTQAVSYGFPAGASVKPINTAVVPPDPR